MTDVGPEIDSGDSWVEKLGSTNNTDVSKVEDGTGGNLWSVHGDGKVSGSVIKDEDDMTSDSADHIATQQSIKAYVDTGLNGKADVDHDATHITGGSDEIDGDKLDIDWNPSTYTPSTSPSEADSLDNLTAHLYGIDNEFGNYVAKSGLTADFPINEYGIVYDDSLSVVGKYSGLIVDSQTLKTGVGQTIAFGDLLFFNASQQWEPANASASGTMLCSGVSLGTCPENTTNSEQKVLLTGFVRATGYSFAVGSIAGNSICYVSTTDGTITQTKPSSSGNLVQAIGWMRTSDTLYFNPDFTYSTVP